MPLLAGNVRNPMAEKNTDRLQSFDIINVCVHDLQKSLEKL
jgi:hypothetical protein